MKPKLLLTISAVYLGLAGLGILISPATVLGVTVDADTPNSLIAILRSFAAPLVGAAVLNWMARNAGPARARNAILLGNTIGFGLSMVLAVIAVLSGGSALGWLFAVISLLFAIGFFLVTREDMSF